MIKRIKELADTVCAIGFGGLILGTLLVLGGPLGWLFLAWSLVELASDLARRDWERKWKDKW